MFCFRSPETEHQPENTGKEPFEVIQIEFKNKNEQLRKWELTNKKYQLH